MSCHGCNSARQIIRHDIFLKLRRHPDWQQQLQRYLDSPEYAAYLKASQKKINGHKKRKIKRRRAVRKAEKRKKVESLKGRARRPRKRH